jgi:hypothetical protein
VPAEHIYLKTLRTLSGDIHTEVKRFAETSMLTQHWDNVVAREGMVT